MRLAMLHGYELTGSGSNEYTRYLSRALAGLGHEVHVICREPHPERIAHVARALDADGRELLGRTVDRGCTLHRLPAADPLPVYVTDKPRPGQKAFPELGDAELEAYHAATLAAVRAVLARHPVDLVQANHLVWQPVTAAETGVPFVVFPHGSSIEYTVRADERCADAALRALHAARALICGSEEVLRRILDLFPADADALAAKSVVVGVGVDTALFAPVADRSAALARLAGEPRGAGKTADQRAELRERLDRGEFEALNDYAETYDQAHPDADLDALIEPFDRGPLLLFVGALTAGKGLQTLIAALPAVLRRHPGTHLAIAGSGAFREVLEALVHAIASGNRALYDHLRERGAALERGGRALAWDDLPDWEEACPALSDRVRFLGRLEHRLLRHLFPCADVAVFPSVFPEAYPLVLLESLANGVPPLVPDFSGFADGLRTLEPLLGRDIVDRMRIPVRSRHAGLVLALTRLLDEQLPAGLRARLRAVAVEHFDWDVVARRMSAAYERALTS